MTIYPVMWRSVAFALSCLAFLSHSTYAVIIRGSWVVVNVSDAVCSPLSYGGVGDGVHNDTLAVQAAIDACVTASGTAVIDSGHTFLTYALEVRNARNFAVRVDGTLRFSNDTAGWSSRYASCIAVTGSAFIAFHGSGLVDGNGAAWWPQPDGFRPGLLHVEGGNDLLIRDTTYLNSPNHNLQLYAANFEVTSTTILASPPCPEVGPSVCAHNTDGIDVHAKPAWIHHNFISVGDDNVAMHDNDTLVEDNVFGTGHGASIGSLGGAINLRNITVRRTSFNGPWQRRGCSVAHRTFGVAACADLYCHVLVIINHSLCRYRTSDAHQK